MRLLVIYVTDTGAVLVPFCCFCRAALTSIKPERLKRRIWPPGEVLLTIVEGCCVFKSGARLFVFLSCCFCPSGCALTHPVQLVGITSFSGLYSWPHFLNVDSVPRHKRKCAKALLVCIESLEDLDKATGWCLPGCCLLAFSLCQSVFYDCVAVLEGVFSSFWRSALNECRFSWLVSVTHNNMNVRFAEETLAFAPLVFMRCLGVSDNCTDKGPC